VAVGRRAEEDLVGPPLTAVAANGFEPAAATPALVTDATMPYSPPPAMNALTSSHSQCIRGGRLERWALLSLVRRSVPA
jgi:hypothetical protein